MADKTKAASQDAVKSAASITWPRIYVGPSLPKAKLPQFTVFANGYPQYVQDLIDKCPSLKQLIVPTSKVQQARRELAVKGTLLNTLSLKIVNEYLQGAK